MLTAAHPGFLAGFHGCIRCDGAADTRLMLECTQIPALHRSSLTRKVRIRAKSPDWAIEQTRFS